MRCVCYFVNICITFLEINKHLKKTQAKILYLTIKKMKNIKITEK